MLHVWYIYLHLGNSDYTMWDPQDMFVGLDSPQ